MNSNLAPSRGDPPDLSVLSVYLAACDTGVWVFRWLFHSSFTFLVVEANIMDLIPCEWCDLEFASKIGRGVHARYAHPVQYNASLPEPASTKSRWSEEELRIMAREEVFLPENTRFVNQALVARLHGKGLFVERTLDSIKGQRKQPKYQQLVREIRSFELSDPLSTLPKRWSTGATANLPRRSGGGVVVPEVREGLAVPGPTRLERLSILRTNLAAYMGHGLYHPEILMAAVDSAERGEPVVGVMDRWFRKVFRVEDCVKPLPENLEHPFEGTRRQVRRLEYARIQALWKKNRSNAAAKILEGEPLGGATYPPDVGAWWADLFSSGLGLMEEREVRKAKLKGQTSPGPDGITVHEWDKVPEDLKASVFNLFLLEEAVPEWMFAARTVLIPKVSQPTVAADFRPISIASVVLRHFHKVLGARIQMAIKIKPEQRAFLEKDGLAENISLLAEVLHASTSRGKPLYAAVLDVRKAFDTVSHAPLMEVLRARGLPHNILRHIWQLYMVGKTTIQLPGKICPGVPMKQGVRQGDPLSPILFNIVMDEALSDQDAFVGFELGGEVVSRLAFADDVVLLAGSRAGLQTNLDRLNRALERLGLRLSAVKSFSLAMAAVPRERRVKVLDERMFRIGTEFLTPLGVDETFKYLGIQFTRGGVKAFKHDLEGPLERISSAPLKPYQRLELLKVFLLPSLTYRLSFARVTMGALKACDVLVRAAVRRWLKLPHDTALGFFHAACSAGGLGIPSLVRSVPVWILGRLRNVLKSNYPPAQKLENQPLFSRRVEWARAVATVGGVTLDSSLKVKNYWRARWSGSVDGADLETARSCRESTAWIGQRASGIPSKDYISYLHIISNSLPSAVRTTRGRRGPSGALPKCRAGCNDAETTYHVIQQCPRTQETRVARHNQVLKVVADRLEERGYRVLREPRYRTSEGVRVPDLVISKPEEDVAHVLDVQVVQSKGMEWSFGRKRAKYAGNKDLIQSVCEWSGAKNVEVLPITISWKGLWHPKAVEGLRKLVMCRPLLCAIPTMVLFGTLLGWRRQLLVAVAAALQNGATGAGEVAMPSPVDMANGPLSMPGGAMGTGLEISAGKEDPVELDSSLALGARDVGPLMPLVTVFLVPSAQGNSRPSFVPVALWRVLGLHIPPRDPIQGHCQAGSLTGAVHLSNDNAGVLRPAQRGQKPRVEQKGKSWLDPDTHIPAQYERNRRYGPLVHALGRKTGGAKLPTVGLCLNASKAVSPLRGNDN
ncbi:hypothetical protein PR048_033773 [Dryococelus australis]|uniref:Reverse transcriptase domain-containing protein n=1 Tax=Dryococelus australis TaxID=614101 RepID=A0ABQ9G2C2_9NEOP|nr:hypothetical protein PR048_033773 [Dryococelus australis]